MSRRSCIPLMLLAGALLECKEPVATREPIQTVSQIRLDTPDPAYRLTPEELRRVRAGFDVSALEDLLRMVRPQWRSEILTAFEYPGKNKPVVSLVELDDSVLQGQLEKVWAPFWAAYSLDDLERDVTAFPGKRVALQSHLREAR